MRRLYIQNAAGDKKDLTQKTHFLHAPSGLGFSRTATYERPQEGFYQNVNDQSDQINIVGDLVFAEKGYEDYRDFINWLLSGQDLKFIYSPFGAEEYSCAVDAESIGKTEIDKQSGALICPMSFRAKTPWTRINPIILNFALNEDSGYKKSPYKYPYRYSRSNASNVIDYTAQGHYLASIVLDAQGEMTSPKLTLLNKYTGETLGRLFFEDFTVGADERLYYSTSPNDSGVWLIAADGGKTDLSPNLDLAYDSFFCLPPGVACQLKLEFTGTSTASTLYIEEHFRSV